MADVVPVRILLIGVGQRGREVYADTLRAMPERARVVAVADPDPRARDRVAAEHGLAPAACHADWPAAVAAGGFDAAIVATPDRDHIEPALAVVAAGRPLLLEKPVVTTPADLVRLRDAVARHAAHVTVAHPLRSMPFFETLVSLVRGGAIGTLMAIDHQEDVGYWHFAHSYVRGNWRRVDRASPLILAKACHDLDLIAHLAGAPATSVASFGELRHFRATEAPPDAPAHCLDGCPAAADCPYHAGVFYGGLRAGVEWPASVVSPSPDPAELDRALRTGPYGRCVYRCDNDVPDHQATIIRFANGVVATLTVTAFAAENTRIVTVRGTREIRGHLAQGRLELFGFPAEGFRLERRKVIDVDPDAGHEQGDRLMVERFVAHARAIRDGAVVAPAEPFPVVTHGHEIAFAAEAARLGGAVVTLAGPPAIDGGRA